MRRRHPISHTFLQEIVSELPKRLKSRLEQAADEKWWLSDAELALEFLVQLGEMGDAVTVEWPKGQSM